MIAGKQNNYMPQRLYHTDLSQIEFSDVFKAITSEDNK